MFALLCSHWKWKLDLLWTDKWDYWCCVAVQTEFSETLSNSTSNIIIYGSSCILERCFILHLVRLHFSSPDWWPPPTPSPPQTPVLLNSKWQICNRIRVFGCLFLSFLSFSLLRFYLYILYSRCSKCVLSSLFSLFHYLTLTSLVLLSLMRTLVMHHDYCLDFATNFHSVSCTNCTVYFHSGFCHSMLHLLVTLIFFLSLILSFCSTFFILVQLEIEIAIWHHHQ